MFAFSECTLAVDDSEKLTTDYKNCRS